MPTADGSIHIDTKIDTSGVNQGTQQINKAVQKNVARPMQSLTKSLGGVMKAIKGVGLALVATIVTAVGNIIADVARDAIGFIREIVSEFDIMGSSVGEKIKPLSDALEVLKGTFVNLLIQAFIPMIPALIEIVNWFTNMLQIATQLIAALFGFESTVGNIMTKAAAGAKKAAKEAKGALAAFDQINVLQQKQETETPEGALATPGSLAIDPKIQAIVDEILRKIQLWKDILNSIFDNPLKALEYLGNLWQAFINWVRNNLPFGDLIADLLTLLGDTWKKMFLNFVETIQNVKKNVQLIFQGIKDFITGVFAGDWKLAWEGLKEIATGVFGVLGSIVEGILNHIAISFDSLIQLLQILFAPVIEWLGEVFEKIKAKIGGAVTGVMTAFAGLTKWFFENVWNPIAAGFGSMFTDIKEGFQTAFNGIKTFIKGIINTIIDYLNGMIEGVVFGVNTVIGSVNALGELVGLPEIQSVTAPRIPRLATGAVIPPNSEFLAIMGDQRSGRNIEAPEDLIRQIVREETGRMQAQIEIRFTGSLAELARQLKPVIDKENVRVGGSLIKSGITI